MTHRTFAPDEAMQALAWLNDDDVVPSWRRKYDGLKVVERALALENHLVTDDTLTMSIIARLPEELVAATGWPDGREALQNVISPVDAIRGLGWAADSRSNGIAVGGIWGDYLPVGCFAVIVALAPALGSGQGVFGEMDGDPVLAYEVLSGKTRLTTDIDKTVEYYF